MRRLMLLFALATLAACGGDASTSPKNPTFPSVAGVYTINGSFSATGTPFSGTLTFAQPSREQPTLTGTCNLTVYESTNVTLTIMDNASVSESGLVGFNIGGSGGLTTWRFTGTLQNGVISGTHTLSDGSESFLGTFTAVKQ